jgi:hypothetical protein
MSITFTDGIHAGRVVDDVVTLDPDYIIWAYRNNPEIGITPEQLLRAVRSIDAQGVDEPDDFGYSKEFADYRVIGGYINDED